MNETHIETAPAKRTVKRKTTATKKTAKTATAKKKTSATTTKTTAAATAAPKKTGPSRRSKPPALLSAAERQQLIADTAFRLAAQRNFQGGDPEQDWLFAEETIDSVLARIKQNTG